MGDEDGDRSGLGGEGGRKWEARVFFVVQWSRRRVNGMERMRRGDFWQGLENEITK